MNDLILEMYAAKNEIHECVNRYKKECNQLRKKQSKNYFLFRRLSRNVINYINKNDA